MTEITKPPVQYPAVSLISIAASLGGLAALGIASLVTSRGFNWRIAFWVGAGIAVIGSIARTRLRETPEFIMTMSAKKEALLYEDSYDQETKSKMPHEEKTSLKTVFAFFSIYCGHPLCFYMIYMYFNKTLKTDFGYATSEVIYHNFLLSLSHFPLSIFISFLSYTVYPLLISKIRGYSFLICAILLPFLITNASSHYHIFSIQVLLLLCTLNDYPSVSIFVKYFLIIKVQAVLRLILN